MELSDAFLQLAVKKFKFQKTLGEKTFAQLNGKDFLFKPSTESNSIAVIVQHLYGNMLSRWTNFLTEDGEKTWRKREAEFEDVLHTKEGVLNAWNKGWDCVLETLESLQPEDIMKTIIIRSQPLLVVEAIIRQLDHYGYHVGQIVYIGRMIKNENWQSLSIPKQKREDYNKVINQVNN